MTTGTAAKRVHSPRMTNSAQRNSDVVTSARLNVLPRPMGSPNLSAPPASSICSFPHPWVIRYPPIPILKIRRPIDAAISFRCIPICSPSWLLIGSIPIVPPLFDVRTRQDKYFSIRLPLRFEGERNGCPYGCFSQVVGASYSEKHIMDQGE